MTGLPPRRVLVTGLSSLRDCVLALPRMAGLRAAEPQSHVTALVPEGAIALLQAMNLADRFWRREDHPAPVWRWRQWRGGFDLVIDAKKQAGEKDLWAWVPFRRVDLDLAFLFPPPPFIVLSPPRGMPAPRITALAKKLALDGYCSVLVAGHTDAQWQAIFNKAAPEQCRDLSGSIGLFEAVVLARASAGWIGGDDALTLLAAMAGTKTAVLTEGADEDLMRLPAAHATWVQCDDVSLVGVADMQKALLA